jgi:hypothetical protein
VYAIIECEVRELQPATQLEKQCVGFRKSYPPQLIEGCVIENGKAEPVSPFSFIFSFFASDI